MNDVEMRPQPTVSTDLLENDVDHIHYKRNTAKSKSFSFSKLWELCLKKCWCKREKQYLPRTVHIGQHSITQKYPKNVIRNQKYNIFTFIPMLLFEQFSVFLNLCFLVMALSQFVPSLRIGYLYTYWGPLGFVLFVTFCREAVDDIRRWKRDREVNSARYTLIVPPEQQKPRRGGSVGSTPVPYMGSLSSPPVEFTEGRSSIHHKQSIRASRGPLLQRRVIASSDIQVGDVIVVEKDQRVPADLLLLRTTEKNGACFIRTDQMDGETDWKLRLAVQATRTLERDDDLFSVLGYAYVEAPRKDIYSFEGNYHQQSPPAVPRASTKPQATSNLSHQLSLHPQPSTSSAVSGADAIVPSNTDATLSGDMFAPIPLTVENTLWSNTVVASGTVVGLVIYTGTETRAVMNSSQPRNKVGLTDKNINHLTILLTITAVILAAVMITLKGYGGAWYKYFWRFFLLFSYIIPLALRVNLDMSKITHSFIIMKDKKLQGCLVRNTTIPEELGRISYLLSDKTGTLTKNEMVFKKLHLGHVSYGADSLQMVSEQLKAYYGKERATSTTSSSGQEAATSSSRPTNKIRKTAEVRLVEAVRALALCHNVTPMSDDSASSSMVNGEEESSQPVDEWDVRADVEPGVRAPDTVDGATFSRIPPANQLGGTDKPISYQASSPDEVALVAWTETVNLTLIHRDLNSMKLSTPNGDILSFNILEMFSFTSESKRMGIIVQEVLPDGSLGEITFYMKGADVVMSQIVSYTDWLEEETGNMAREGLRTLVIGKKVLTPEQYADFAARYQRAKTALTDRQAKQVATQALLERDLELLCVTGVEDKLQDAVIITLETLQQAGVRVWMLTGDKLETAVCIAQSSRLVPRLINLHVFKVVSTREAAHQELNALRHHPESALIITGGSLEVCLLYYEHEFMELACQSAAVVVCRCSPTQKATIVELVKRHTGLRVAAIGDGGNDVSMIQAADVGIGIEGKEGKQASLASDFSLMQFSHVAPLLLVHGRNSYKNTATLSQFIIHRGAIISVMQVIFSAIFYFAAVTLFPGLLMVGYSTLFTMFPVFSLILDKDISDEIAMRYPELYKDLRKGRDLNFKTFFIWVLISIYQGFILIYGALLLFEDDFVHVVSITFTALILTELLMVALTIRSWHLLMVLAELVSLLIYLLALIVLPNYFDQDFLKTSSFVWKTLAITAVSCIPLFILKFLRFKLRPPIYAKLK